MSKGVVTAEQFTVTVDPLYINKTEMTRSQQTARSSTSSCLKFDQTARMQHHQQTPQLILLTAPSSPPSLVSL